MLVAPMPPMTLLSTPRERYLGGFFVEDDEPCDAIYRSRRVRYVIVLDSYADAVTWRRLMTEEENFIIPLSQAAGAAADQLRETIAQADAEAEEAAAAEREAETPAPPEEAPPLEPSPFELALAHLHALLERAPSYTDYDEYFVAVEKCAHCEATLSDGDHADDCAWQAARRFLLEQALDAHMLAA